MALPPPYWEDEHVTLFHGDAYELSPLVAAEYAPDTILADPPYGINHRTDYSRFKGGTHDTRRDFMRIEGDDRAFDPAPFLALGCRNVVLWGANNYFQLLPYGTLLVWNKRRPEKLGKFMSDCEVAWINRNRSVYLFNHVWDGWDRDSEKGLRTMHPTQKPVALMRWCLEACREPGVVLDPFCGSGPVAQACQQMGLRYIGIESHEPYLLATVSRLSQGALVL